MRLGRTASASAAPENGTTAPPATPGTPSGHGFRGRNPTDPSGTPAGRSSPDPAPPRKRGRTPKGPTPSDRALARSVIACQVTRYTLKRNVHNNAPTCRNGRLRDPSQHRTSVGATRSVLRPRDQSAGRDLNSAACSGSPSPRARRVPPPSSSRLRPPPASRPELPKTGTRLRCAGPACG